MRKTFYLLIVLVFLVQACAAVNPVSTSTPTSSPAQEPTVGVTETPTEDTASRLERLGGYPCPESDFTCINVTVPLDHFNPDDKRTINVVFGVLPATGERKGMFVTAVGGPGGAGLQSADSYTSYFDESIPEHFDIVFFDQRGVGQSGGLQCAQAAAELYRAEWDASTPEGEAALTESARKFANDCVAEMGNPEILPYLGTEQAIEDLEFFRETMGDEKIWLYGESYGTQFAQTYAAAHPDRLAALILDGTVDLTLSIADYLEEQARAFNNTLQLTLEACNDDEFCAESMGGGDAAAAYNRLAARLKRGALEYDFPLPSGGRAKRTFTFSDLEAAVSSYMYSEAARMIFLRALAAYSRNEDIVPMARILYDALYLDPETLEAVPDPSYSDAVYYAVECLDYSYFSGTPEQKAEAYLRAGDPLDASLPNFASIFYGDLPCVFWPHTRKDKTRPAPFTGGEYPTLVLNATADPATPYSNGVSVFHSAENSYMVTETGGPHVIFGWGMECVDSLVTDFLVNDQLPAGRETTCEGEVTRAFVPLTPLKMTEAVGPLDALSAMDDEIYYLPEYYYWDVETPTSVGCPFGGAFSFEATDAGDAMSFHECAFIEGFVITGNAENDYEAGAFEMNVKVTGLKDGTLTYTRDADDVRRVTGTYGGEEIDLTR